jgi:hypothetical protein
MDFLGLWLLTRGLQQSDKYSFFFLGAGSE